MPTNVADAIEVTDEVYETCCIFSDIPSGGYPFEVVRMDDTCRRATRQLGSN